MAVLLIKSVGCLKLLEILFTESQNHRMTSFEKDHNDHLVSTPLLCVGLPTARPGCPENFFLNTDADSVFRILAGDWEKAILLINSHPEQKSRNLINFLPFLGDISVPHAVFSLKSDPLCQEKGKDNITKQS